MRTKPQPTKQYVGLGGNLQADAEQWIHEHLGVKVAQWGDVSRDMRIDTAGFLLTFRLEGERRWLSLYHAKDGFGIM